MKPKLEREHRLFIQAILATNQMEHDIFFCLYIIAVL